MKKQSLMLGVAAIIVILATVAVTVTILFSLSTNTVVRRLDANEAQAAQNQKLAQCRSTATGNWDSNVADALKGLVDKNDQQVSASVGEAQKIRDQLKTCSELYGPSQTP